jgi:hypothetical protein
VDEEEEDRRGGARNPKVERLSVRVAAGINERLEVVADLSGMNKGTIAAFCIACGLRWVELMFANIPDMEGVQQAVGESVAAPIASGMLSDIAAVGAVQTDPTLRK